MHTDKYFCFDVYQDNEQEEAGDTLIHSFIKPDWPFCQTRYFYFHGTINGEASPSTSPIFTLHNGGGEMYVISIGKHGEAEILHGHVKLKEGAGVTITRDDVNNALVIASPVAEYAGFGNHWEMSDPSGQMAAGMRWEYDEVKIPVTGVGVDSRLYTSPMRNLGFFRICSCTIKLTRGPDAGFNPLIYAAVVDADTDVRNNQDQNCIGWSTDAGGLVSCFNGNGANTTRTDFPWSNWPPIWLKWIRYDLEIQFFGNGSLVATHNTNLPATTNSCFFVYQLYGQSASPRTGYMMAPKFDTL